MRRFAISLLLFFAPVVAIAQAPVLVVEITPEVHFGLDLETGQVRTILYQRLDGPVPPVPVNGLHVLVIDDENVRGNLPQLQVNIFTSKKLIDWLEANCTKAADGQPAYRFSSNDSFPPGDPARDLELPVWVEGWDTLMKAVNDGKVKLPAWAVSNSKHGVIEPLPASVEACLKRLEEFK